MLSELSEFQDSDESVWGGSKVSFTVETREEDAEEIVRRVYTFSKTMGLDEWVFHEFEEYRTNNTKHIMDRSWRQTRNISWDDTEASSVDVPPSVEKEFEKLLGAEKINIQKP